MLLRDVLDQGFPRLKLDFANTALQTPPLRVHLHVILELVLVAQHFVANLDGRKSRLIIDGVNNYHLFSANENAYPLTVHWKASFALPLCTNF